MLRNIASGLRALFRKQQASQELDEEFDSFVEMATEDKMRDGMTRAEAVRAVRLERGSRELTKEVVYAAGWESVVDGIWRDIRFGVRSLRKSPGFMAVAVLTFALGIGANTAIFTMTNGLMLRTLPIKIQGGSSNFSTTIPVSLILGSTASRGTLTGSCATAITSSRTCSFGL